MTEEEQFMETSSSTTTRAPTTIMSTTSIVPSTATQTSQIQTTYSTTSWEAVVKPESNVNVIQLQPVQRMSVRLSLS